MKYFFGFLLCVFFLFIDGNKAFALPPWYEYKNPLPQIGFDYREFDEIVKDLGLEQSIFLNPKNIPSEPSFERDYGPNSSKFRLQYSIPHFGNMGDIGREDIGDDFFVGYGNMSFYVNKPLTSVQGAFSPDFKTKTFPPGWHDQKLDKQSTRSNQEVIEYRYVTGGRFLTYCKAASYIVKKDSKTIEVQNVVDWCKEVENKKVDDAEAEVEKKDQKNLKKWTDGDKKDVEPVKIWIHQRRTSFIAKQKSPTQTLVIWRDVALVETHTVKVLFFRINPGSGRAFNSSLKSSIKGMMEHIRRMGVEQIEEVDFIIDEDDRKKAQDKKRKA